MPDESLLALVGAHEEHTQRLAVGGARRPAGEFPDRGEFVVGNGHLGEGVHGAGLGEQHLSSSVVEDIEGPRFAVGHAHLFSLTSVVCGAGAG